MHRWHLSETHISPRVRGAAAESYTRRGGDDNERPFFPPLDALDAVEDGGSWGTSSPLRQRAIAMSGIPDAVAPEA